MDVQAVANPQSSIVCKISLERLDGSSKQFIVNEHHRNQVYNIVEGLDISASSQTSGPLMLPPTAVNNYPPHALRHANVVDLNNYHRSQHSDTSCSSLGSDARSLLSAGSAHTDSAATGSGSTR